MNDQAVQNHTPAPRLPFPPLTRSYILHCSYHHWHPRYRSITPKARLIPLTLPFLTYLRADGILLPPEPTPLDPDLSSTETDSGIFSSPSTPSSTFSSHNDDDDPPDPSLLWPDIHSKITSTISELGGNVCPKLNWSAPKDATWINATNSMECRSPNDVYLLLKSSDFITHDLEQAFDGCVDAPARSPKPAISEKDEANEDMEIPYHLTLRKTIPSFLPSCEFRCFVRTRTLLCICQRDLNYYDFLPPLVPTLRPLIITFFKKEMRETFEEENFVFDVYIPPPHKRVWLVDINPWAGRTDLLLFSWMEVLGMRGPISPRSAHGETESGGGKGEEGRESVSESGNESASENNVDGEEEEEESEDEDEDEEEIFTPEFRLVGRNDPEAYSFNTPQYSAHKMPKDVVDASGDGEAGLREFMGRWREIVKEQEEGERRDGEG